MGAASITVLALMAAATLWLLVYTRRTLPRRLDERIADSIKAFGTAIELRFPSHQGLMTRVIGLGQAMGRMMGMSDAVLRELEIAARLRDIGLCSVPYRLVNGLPYGDWNAAERSAYFHHAEAGAAMLESVPELSRLAPIVRYHHTRYDGADDSTSPCGTSLPIEARILKVATDYVWHERQVGSLLAREMIRTGLGKAYCPEAAGVLLAVLSSTRVEQREPLLV